MPILDQLGDANGIELARLARQFAFPDFVKKASHVRLLQRPGALAAYAHPNPSRPLYPCDCAASTWMSALYFLDKRAEFRPKDQERIEKRLTEFANYWRIGGAYRALQKEAAAAATRGEEALPDSHYAWVWVDEAGRKERRLPMKTAAQVLDAAEYLHTYRDQIPFAHRHAMATRVHDRVQATGAGLGKYAEFVERQAGRGVCSPRAVERLLLGRALLIKDARLRDQVRAVAAAVRGTPGRALGPDRLVKMAAMVDQIDRELGLPGKYTETLPRPEDVLFEATFTKVAHDHYERVQTTTGRVYEKQALGRLKLADLDELFGTDFSDRVTTKGALDLDKLAEEVTTLPRPDAQMLEGLLSDAGVSPLTVKAARAPHGLTPQELGVLARQYTGQ